MRLQSGLPPRDACGDLKDTPGPADALWLQHGSSGEMEKVMENRGTRSGRTTCSRRLDLVALVMLGLAAAPAAANIDLEMRPALQTVFMGPAAEVEIGLYAVSDDDTDQFLSALQAIIQWQPEFLRLLGIDSGGAVPLMGSGFWVPDPYNIN